MKKSTIPVLVLMCVVLLHLVACKQQSSTDTIRTNVTSVLRKYLQDSVKAASIITFSNYFVISEYDSLVMNIKYTNLQIREARNSYKDAVNRKQSLDQLSPIMDIVPLTALQRQQAISSYKSLDTSIEYCASTLKIDSQIKKVLFAKLEDKAKQARTVCYKINCTYKDAASKIHNVEFTLDTLFKVAGKSEL